MITACQQRNDASALRWLNSRVMELEGAIELPLSRFPVRNRLKPFYCVMALSAWCAWGLGLLCAQPANDLFATSISISGTNVLITGNNVGATSEAGEPQHAGVSGNRSVWWTWTATFGGKATITTAGSDFDTLLGVYTGSSVSSLTEVAANDDYQGLSSQASFFSPAGQTYQIAVDGYAGDSGNVQLQVELVEAQQATNDLFANRTIVTGTNAVVSGNNLAATFEPGEPDHAGVSGGASVWWSWTAPFSGIVTITTSGSSFDTVLGVYRGGTVAGLVEVASNDEESGQTDHTSKVTFFARAGQAYEIAVDGYSDARGDIRLNLQLLPSQPAPAWTLPDPYGQLVSSTSFAGKVVIFNFWASWCVPCKVEMPDLVALQDEYGADGLAIIGATIGDAHADTIAFLSTNVPALNYQIIISDNALAQAYGGIAAIPTTFIINRQNQIVMKYVGTRSKNTFESQILPLLYEYVRLFAQMSGNELALTWPATAVNRILESAPAPQGPVWTQWPTEPTLIDGLHTVRISPEGANRFFRLRLSQ